MNEIKDYVAAYYLFITETAWCILSYYITWKEPAITSIYIYLPSTNFAQMYQKNGSAPFGSLLLRYFARPLDERSNSLTITDYYNHYRLTAFVPGPPLIHNQEWLEVLNPSFSIQEVVWHSTDSWKITYLYLILP